MIWSDKCQERVHIDLWVGEGAPVFATYWKPISGTKLPLVNEGVDTMSKVSVEGWSMGGSEPF